MVDFKEVRECTTQGTDLDLQLDTMQTSFLFDLPRSLYVVSFILALNPTQLYLDNLVKPETTELRTRSR